jgi:hypothetical protein
MSVKFKTKEQRDSYLRSTKQAAAASTRTSRRPGSLGAQTEDKQRPSDSPKA